MNPTHLWPPRNLNRTLVSIFLLMATGTLDAAGFNMGLTNAIKRKGQELSQEISGATASSSSSSSSSAPVSGFLVSSAELRYTGGYADVSTIKPSSTYYLMYLNEFSSSPPSQSGTAIYQSTDAYTWVKISSIVFDGVAMARAFLTPSNGIRVYHPQGSAEISSSTPSNIVSDYSVNGSSFTRDSGTRISPTSGYTVAGPSVIRLGDGTYRMYFEEYPFPTAQQSGKIYGATSVDGLSWTRDSSTSIESSDSVEGSGCSGCFSQVLHPFVMTWPGGGYIMFYNSHSRLFSAHSWDGYIWTKLGQLSGVTRGADADVVIDPQGRYRIYYGDYSESTLGVIYTGILTAQ